MNLIIYLLGIISALSSFILSFDFYDQPFVLLCTCVIFCAFQYAFYHFCKEKKNFYVISVIIAVICLIISIPGLLYIKDVILEKYMQVSVYTFNILRTYNFHDDFIMLFISMMGMILPINILNIYFFTHHKYILSIIALFPFIFVEILFTITPPLYCSLYILYCLIMVLSQRQIKIQILPIFLSLCFMLSIFYVVPPSSYFHPKQVRGQNNSSRPVRQDNVVYDLMKQGNRYYTNRVDLVVNGISHQSFKLRGNVYPIFNGQWKQNTSEYGYHYNLISRIQTVSDYLNCDAKKITVINNHHQYIVYTPYFFKEESSTLRYFNSHFEGEKEESFDIVIPNSQWNDYLNLSMEEKLKFNQEQMQLDRYYDQFEDEDVIPEITYSVLYAYIEKNKLYEYKDIDDLIKKTKKAIFKDTTYSLTPGTTPNNEDFFDYFLNKNKKGYCVHYASTLAVILKILGFEAHFVTGYQVNGKNSQNNSINVLDSDAHAWVEIVDPILGIIPIEATPASSSPTINDQPQNITPTSPDNDTPKDNNQNNNDIQDIEDQEFKIPQYVYHLSIFIIIIIIIYLQSRLRYQKHFKDLNNNQKVCKMYYYLAKLNLDITEEIIDIIKKAKFSNHQLNDDEYQQVLDFYNDAILHIYQSSFINRIKIKYIYAYI